MKRGRIILLLVSVVVAIWIARRIPTWWRYYHLTWIDRTIFRMDQGANTVTTFYGQVVDQGGHGIKGAAIELEVHGVNEHWAYEEGGPNARDMTTHLALVTRAGGQFEFRAKGTLIVVKSIHRDGYRWLYDKDSAHRSGKIYGCNWAYAIATEHKPGPYIPDPKSPAIFVLVRDGVKDVHVAPSRGGADESRYDTIVNEPTWPNNPSLKDVRYVGPETH